MDIKTLNKHRGTLRQRLTLFESYLKPLLDTKETNSVDINELRLRLSKIRELSLKFDDIQSQIELLEDDIETQMQERESTENKFYKLTAQGESLLEYCEKKINNENTSSVSSSLVNLKLPSLQIPPFDGNPNNWLSFRDTYLSLIHKNAQIDDINKFYYLKQFLKGSASIVIESVTMSSDNYSVAWSLLCERFDNKRLLVKEHIKCLFNLEPLQRESQRGLRNILDILTKNLSALNSLGESTDKWDSMIIYMASTKLDRVSAGKWEESSSAKETPTLDEFYSFLRQRATVLETIHASSGTHSNCMDKNQLFKSKSFISSSNINIKENYSCVVCKQSHKLHECPKFKSLPLDQRIATVSQWRLCVNCFRSGHQSYQCKMGTCRICKRKHNTLLHKQHIQSQPTQQPVHINECLTTNEIKSSTDINNMPTTNATHEPYPSTSISMSAVTATQALLSTALVQVTNNDKPYILRAILDSGSQSSFITTKAQQIISCIKNKSSFQCVSGLGNSTFKLNEHCNIQIHSLHNNFKIPIKCYILPRITNNIPQVPIRVRDLEIPEHIQLADPLFYYPNDIDLLLGADVFWDLMGTNRLTLGIKKPILQETQLGWVVAGPIDSKYVSSSSNITSCHFSQEIREQLSRFWELEEIPKDVKPQLQENYCEKLFAETTHRNINGRFCVQIPFKESPDILGNSYDLAYKRFIQLEKKLSRKLQLKEEYKSFIREYEHLGHMTEVNKPNFGYYLPHHSVIRESSETTKLRVVFDGSAKTSSGVSLNDIQHIGPVVQDDLFSILLRYRQHRYAISADIEKMYRQILVEPNQRKLQMILWRDEPTLPIKVFELNTVTYGTASAPFLSTRCLKQLSLECENKNISREINENFYVDDFLSGASTERELNEMISSVTAILNSAHLPLRKFRTNASTIFGNELSSLQPKNLDTSSQSNVLGLKWDHCKDVLQFPVNIDIKSKTTKRTILSDSAKLFDPLGMLSLTTIIPKIMLQKLWLSKLDWDDPVDTLIEKEWSKFKYELPQLSNIEIPRCTIIPNAITIELHSFSDASQSSFASAIYLRSIDEAGHILVRLLCAKTKVAPLKSITIPRLELCGALLSARLSKKVLEALRCKIDKIYHWTDSSIVLGWITSEPRDLKPFIANRVTEIQESTSLSSWRHVPGHDNPADLASRGVSPKSVLSCTLWWDGPSFLNHEELDWPKVVEIKNIHNLPERKTTYYPKTSLHCALPSASARDSNRYSVVNFERFSKFTTLQKSVAYVLRFINNARNKNNKLSGCLSVHELNSALRVLIKQHQIECFSKEINVLSKNENIPSNSHILSLSPFLDEQKVLLVGGRLQNSPETYNKKHPVLLNSNHAFTKLLFRHYHLKFLHCGPQSLLSNIRNYFWPIRGRVLARSTVNNCKICKILKAESINPIMGNLPASRVTPSFPFEISGVDFGGPFYITDRKGRGCKISKCYLCLFVCFTTKALHLEVVSDLTSNAFILSLRRFISRRGKPVDIYCDNGTNFVGASNELANFLKSNRQDISAFAADEGVNFKFLPPGSPHLGGLWESSIKSAKFHSTRVLGSQHLTFEELSTLFSQIEAILNSRPLTPLSSDPNDLNSLTPGHFLIGRELTSLPSPNFMDARGNSLDRYERLEQLRQHFWTRWRNEYLCELQQRAKWRIKQKGFQEGDLVVLKDENTPPLKWRMGRIQRLYPGPDNIVRVVDVKTARGILRRAVHRLCCLPDPGEGSRNTESFEGGENVPAYNGTSQE